MRYFKSKKNIGIYGGTFDPVHFGHLRLSHLALSRLDLDEIWWIVSLSNPLKNERDISNFEERYINAKKSTYGSKIVVSDLERKLNTNYTVDVLTYLKNNFCQINFIWIMGIDNFDKFHLWKNWKKIFYQVPIAIFDRPFYSLSVLNSKSLSYFRKNRINESKAKKLKIMVPPSWIFLTGWSSNISSSRLNHRKKK